MAENKEITTLHPYMNRNKNRYPNVKEENIPDTIQRKLTAGQGISISPDNVISATGGDSYTRSETDALLDTKADKVALENVNKAVPTDIAVKDGKLGLKHDTTWLTNQNAITLGDGLTYDEATKTLKVSGGKGGISVIELTDKNGTISSTQLVEINANPQNFSFKYNGKILLFTKADSTTYQYCNNTTSSSDNNVMTTSTLLTITSSTGAYTIAENVHNVVANSIHPANGGDLTNIQVGSKVYSIPSGGSGGVNYKFGSINIDDYIEPKTYNLGDSIKVQSVIEDDSTLVVGALFRQFPIFIDVNVETAPIFIPTLEYATGAAGGKQRVVIRFTCIKAGTLSERTKIISMIDLTLIKNAGR